METYLKMQALLEQIKPDVEKVFDKGNGSAGTRVRQAMQEIKAMAQTLRTEIQEAKKQKA
jgi:hypothetical protein